MDVTPGIRRDAAPHLETVGEDEALVARIRSEIGRSGPMTFARFMELALYDPDGGYYRSSEARPGRGGDFLTAPETHPIFGDVLARVMAEVWERLDRPRPFVLREHGAGTGTLGLGILDRLERDGSALANILRYDPVEMEPRRLATIAARFADAGRTASLVDPGTSGTPTAPIAPNAPRSPIVGVVVGNEILDALPTHRLVMRETGLLEVHVGVDGDRFVDVELPLSSPALADRLETEGIRLVVGQRAEVCLAVDTWMGAAAAGLERGLFLLIDYGYPAQELYDPLRRRDGTLRAYLRQRVHVDPYRHVGRQDLTAHVDVTAVERAAERAGLAHLGTTTQAEFLVGAGAQELLQGIQADPATTLEAHLALRSSLMRLLDPAAMGRFRVMGFGRDWPDGPPPAGFAFRLDRGQG